ncbi:patatin [Amycolatopsis antarctica]|uniref:Patatin n=1 Tax=Amycolatopsis antarctica TaxID=1854586 RepID=A0A263D2A1_9PSEU|nr:patatin-like phospholipase family protein [Amycolatopsis antarctica]OZM72583.1 patatin [Amycolatopsis antarctica]
MSSGGGVGLCLSGGGYRAMLFHTGALLRLNELGWLPRLDVVSSVSGGSLAAGILARYWDTLDFGIDGVARNFDANVLEPVRAAARLSLDVRVALRAMVKPGISAGEELAASYRRHVLGDIGLRELPAQPRFVFTAANLQTGALWRFSRDTMGDKVVGGSTSPEVSLATAVAASSAFPPLLSPVQVPMPRWDVPGNGRTERPAKVVLSDGGVYDNLGLEPTDGCELLLVSDAGLRMPRTNDIARDWARHMLRVVDVIDNQVRSLRKHELIESYVDGSNAGAYWASYSRIGNFGLPDALPAPAELTHRLAQLPSRCKRTPELTQERLLNWGYAVCDAGMRRWVAPDAARPRDYPFASAGLG